MDAIYFLGILAVLAVGYGIANRDSSEAERMSQLAAIRDFSLPALEFDRLEDLGRDFPYVFVRLERPAPPRLVLAEDLESVMVEVRAALLESAAPVEIRPDEQLAVRVD